MVKEEKLVKSILVKDKLILITGGYGYLGQGIVSSLLVNGAKVVVLGRDIKKFRLTFPNSIYESCNLYFEYCDVSSEDSISKAFENISKSLGKIDNIINNAFYLKGQNPETISNDEWALGIDGTLNSVFRCIKLSISYLKESKGSIVNLSSMYGLVSPDFSIYEESPEYLNPPHYGAAKAGVVQLTKYYANYLGPLGIRVNSVSPGPFPSKEVQKDKGFVDRLANKTALKRIGEPQDLGGVFTFLCSDAASYITGQNFIIDGGWTSVR